MPELDIHKPNDPCSTTRDYERGEARTTTGLRVCGEYFKAWTKNPSAENATKLSKARIRFRELCRGQR